MHFKEYKGFLFTGAFIDERSEIATVLARA
jgi:hypothetical protein